MWGEWEEWDNCPTGCPEIQNKTRTRDKRVEADFGGKECEGKDFEKNPCSVAEELKEDVSTLKMAKEALEKEIEDLKSNNTKLEEASKQLNNKLEQCKCDEQNVKPTEEPSSQEPQSQEPKSQMCIPGGASRPKSTVASSGRTI